MADAAARPAASAPCTRRFPLPTRDLNPAIGSFVQSQWQRAWDEQPSNELRAIKPQLKPWPSSLHKNRHNEACLCRLSIGHTYATHGYLLCGDDRQECSECRVPLTVAHILLVCPKYGGSRRRHLGNIDQDITLSHLLGDDSIWIPTGRLFSFVFDIRFPVIYSSC